MLCVPPALSSRLRPTHIMCNVPSATQRHVWHICYYTLHVYHNVWANTHVMCKSTNAFQATREHISYYTCYV